MGITVDGTVCSRGSGGIVAACVLGRGVRPGVVGIEHLVVALKEQVLVVVAELGGYLLPQVLVFLLDVVIDVHIGLQPRCVTLGVGSRVVVDVEDAIESGVDYVIDYLVDALHPGFIHLAVSVHVVEPGHRHADGAEAGILEHGEQFGFGLGLAPAGLGCQLVHGVIVEGIERVAQVPANLHIVNGLRGLLEAVSPSVGGHCLPGVELHAARQYEVHGVGAFHHAAAAGGQRLPAVTGAADGQHVGAVLVVEAQGDAAVALHQHLQ